MGILKDKTVYCGRPSDKRIEKEEKAYDLLEKCGIEFERVDHDAANTIEECLEVDELLEMEICKNLFLCNSSKTNYYLLLMPGSKKFRTAELSKSVFGGTIKSLHTFLPASSTSS
jgi:Ala-tRNA(Pro) deacylase